jgi:hypothetical protein
VCGLVGGHEAFLPLDVRPDLRQRLVDVSAAPLNCAQSRLPTFGMSRSIVNLRRVIVSFVLGDAGLKDSRAREGCRMIATVASADDWDFAMRNRSPRTPAAAMIE